MDANTMIVNHSGDLTFDASMLKDIVIAGGAFTSLFHNEPIKDVDVFILNDNATLYNHFKKKFPSAKQSADYTTVSNGSIYNVLTDETSGIQIITTGYKTREELISHFDMVHCQTSMIYEPGKNGNKVNSTLFINRRTYDAILGKKIIANTKIANHRMSKMKKKGWELG